MVHKKVKVYHNTITAENSFQQKKRLFKINKKEKNRL